MDNQESLVDALPLPKLETYFEPKGNRYWIKDADSKWIPLNKEDIKPIMEMMGYSCRSGKGKNYSEVDLLLTDVRAKNNICYAGEVGGQKEGIRENNGNKYLITRGPSLVPAVKGDWGLIRELGERLFGPEQLPYVLGWSKNAVRSLYNGITKRGQLLVLAGPHGCGKSFWQNRVITPMLGGRVARPMQYMTGQTSFNEDIIQCEHLLLEDENSRIDLRTRREFGTAIKGFAVNNVQRLHGKGKNALVVESSHWMSLSVNDEAENLGCMPPMDESLLDKIILLKCNCAITAEWPGNDPVKLQAFQEAVVAQIPAFNYYLLNEHEIPKEISDIRFGVTSYQDDELMSRIDGMSPESELEMIIDSAWKGLADERKSLRITGMDLQSQLEGHPEFSYRARKLLYFNTATGVYLERLHRRKPLKFVKPKMAERPRVWTIDWSSD